MPNNIYGLSGSAAAREKLSQQRSAALQTAPASLGLEEVRRRLIDGIEGEDPTAAARLDELTHRERLEYGRLDGDDGELDIPRGLERVAGLL